MASYDEVMTALRNADSAGDHEAATRLAAIAKGLKDGAQQPNASASLIPDSTPMQGSGPQPEPSLWDKANAGVESIANTAVGAAGMFTGALAIPTQGIASLINGTKFDPAKAYEEGMAMPQQALDYLEPTSNTLSRDCQSTSKHTSSSYLWYCC